jgi:zinc and cadmium transporter
MTQLLLYGFIGGFFSLAGGLLLLWKEDWARRFMTPLLAFAAGAFLGASFLDILPEALELTDEPHPVLLAALVGFLLFFLLERVLMRYFFHSHGEKHEHSDHTETLPPLLILGDSVHNFLDGVLIALAFVANPALGLTTALAVAAHEIPQEIGDVSVLLSQGWAKGKIIAVNVLQSLLTFPGIFLGYYAGTSLEGALPYLLAGAAGIFLYLGASDLVPELHHRTSHKHFFRVVLPLLFGVALIGYLIAVAHG